MAALLHKELFSRVSLIPFTSTVPGQRGLKEVNLIIYSSPFTLFCQCCQPGHVDADICPSPSPGEGRDWFSFELECLVKVPKVRILRFKFHHRKLSEIQQTSNSCFVSSSGWSIRDVQKSVSDCSFKQRSRISPCSIVGFPLIWNGWHSAIHPRDALEKRCRNTCHYSV